MPELDDVDKAILPELLRETIEREPQRRFPSNFRLDADGVWAHL
jgi:hypothetical protein